MGDRKGEEGGGNENTKAKGSDCVCLKPCKYVREKNKGAGGHMHDLGRRQKQGHRVRGGTDTLKEQKEIIRPQSKLK